MDSGFCICISPCRLLCLILFKYQFLRSQVVYGIELFSPEVESDSNYLCRFRFTPFSYYYVSDWPSKTGLGIKLWRAGFLIRLILGIWICLKNMDKQGSYFLASWSFCWDSQWLTISPKSMLIPHLLCGSILALYPLVLIILHYYTFLVVNAMLPVFWKFLSDNFPAYSSVGNNVIAHGHHSHRALWLLWFSSQKWQGAAQRISYGLLRSNDIPLTAPAVIMPTNLSFPPHSLLAT